METQAIQVEVEVQYTESRENNHRLSELSDLELVLVGGGIGEVIIQ